MVGTYSSHSSLETQPAKRGWLGSVPASCANRTDQAPGRCYWNAPEQSTLCSLPVRSLRLSDWALLLTEAVFRERATGATHTCPVRHLFLFIGADPNTGWLNSWVTLDNKGFVVTGADSTAGASDRRRPVLPLETSRPSVFAIGDVRAGSTKRVASAVGEGAVVVAQIHSVIAAEPS